MFIVFLVGGIWLGDVDVQGIFDFFVLILGIYQVIYDYIDLEGCEGIDIL